MIFCHHCAAERDPPHVHCSSCGLWITGLSPGEICAHHTMDPKDSWAMSNRIWCALLHRGEIPVRLPVGDRADDFWNVADAGNAADS